MKHSSCRLPLLVFVLAAAVVTGCSRPAPPQNAQSGQGAPAPAAAPPQAAPAGTVPAAPPSSGPAARAASASNPATAASAPSAAPAGAKALAAAPASPAAAPATAPAPPPPPREATLSAGTVIEVETVSALSTNSNKSGEPISATLSEPIVDGDWVIAAKGAPVSGVIAAADPGGRVKGVASMSIRMTKLTLADGRTIDLSTSSHSVKAKSGVKKDATKVGVGAGAGALIGAIAGGKKGAAIGAGVGAGAGTGVVLATRGDPAVIPAGAIVKFRLTDPITVTKR